MSLNNSLQKKKKRMSKKPNKKNKPLFTSNEWTFDSLESILKEVEIIAKDELGLDYYPLQLEIISADQMIDAYATNGLPIYYQHWSIGKRFLRDQQEYLKGRSGLAFEIVMNTNPAIALLMENNTATMQTLVMAHLIGHAAYFKNNYMYKQWTHPDFIVEYMKFAKNYIISCEEKYGEAAVEEILDAAHALQYNSIDKFKRKTKTKKQQLEKIEGRKKYERESFSDIWKIISKELNSISHPNQRVKAGLQYKKKILPEPEENLLYFLEKNSPILQPWQREILRIVRKLGTYWWPQMGDKVSNEGFACFVHYYIMNRLFEKGLITEGSMLEFIQNHSNVVFQTTPDLRSDDQKVKDRYNKRPKPFPYSGINPYGLGFAMFQDIKRICENPTEEDKLWFPDIAGKDWKEVIVNDILKNFRDESFIRQFLSPKVIRDFKFFSIRSDDQLPNKYEVTDIHNTQGYREIRKTLSEMHDANNKIPVISITDVDIMDTRKLYLSHKSFKGKLLGDKPLEVLKYVENLWGYPIVLRTVDENGETLEIYETDKKL